MMNTILRAKIRISEVNKAASDNPSAFFSVCNGKYEQKVRSVAEKIKERIAQTHIIMLSGPSASGKTTTSMKIKEELAKLGITAITISMDDFFKGKEKVPAQPDGKKDFESISALDLDLLKSCLAGLIYKGRAELPVFNFKLGERDKKTRAVELSGGNVAIVEGLHALDTVVTEDFPPENVFKLYVSVSSDFVGQSGDTILNARQMRLIRRTIRDFRFRGSSPENTLDMWDDVCEGEDRYIRPFKKYADMTINSAFSCEPCLFRSQAEELFSKVPEGSIHYDRAAELIRALSEFRKIPMELVPSDSMLREFIGGSIYFNASAGKK